MASPVDRDEVWNAVVELMLGEPGMAEQPSRYGDKPALTLAGREIAHAEGLGIVDVRLTRASIRALPPDPRIRHRGSSDWVDLELTGADQVHEFVDLFRAAISANRRPPPT